MNLRLVESVARAVLYEGYLLYPYRPSAIKNRQRFNFGVVYPQSYGLAHNEPWSMQTECLVTGDEQTRIDARVRFLHLLAREKAGGWPSWQEAVEREVIASEIGLGCCAGSGVPYEFPREVKSDNGLVRRQENVNGLIEIAAEQAADRLFRLTVRILNLTPWEPASQGGMEADDEEARSEARAETMLRALVSAHTILSVRGGEFVSLLDPPEELCEAAAVCRNIGTYPVLVGEEGERDCLFSSPIILYDYPQIAPESAGDLFDGTEIDEILTLRILTLTDDEKREMRESDERARRILERSEALPAEQLLKMHGVLWGRVEPEANDHE
jgi:hypothetical protein